MKRKGIIAAIAACIATAALAAACPIDGLDMVFTGTTKTVDGKLLYQHRCPKGHVTWIVQ